MWAISWPQKQFSINHQLMPCESSEFWHYSPGDSHTGWCFHHNKGPHFRCQSQVPLYSLCFWLTGCKSKFPWFPPRLWLTFFIALQNTMINFTTLPHLLKDTDEHSHGRGTQSKCVGRSKGLCAAHWHLNVSSHPEALRAPSFWVFIVAPVLQYDWLNCWPMVISSVFGYFPLPGHIKTPSPNLLIIWLVPL